MPQTQKKEEEQNNKLLKKMRRKPRNFNQFQIRRWRNQSSLVSPKLEMPVAQTERNKIMTAHMIHNSNMGKSWG